MKQTLVAILFGASAIVFAQPPPGQPQGQARGGRGGGPRGADPLVLDDHAGFDSIFDGRTLKGWDGDPQF